MEAGSSDSSSEEITRKFESLQEEKKENEALKRTWIEELKPIAREKYPEAKLLQTSSSANMFCFEKVVALQVTLKIEMSREDRDRVASLNIYLYNTL